MSSPCEYHKDCDIGMYCQSTTCTPVISRGQQCDNSALQQCEFGSDCFNGKCVGYATVSNEKALYPTTSSFVCDTFHADFGTSDPDTRYCNFAPNLIPEDFSRDASDLNCLYNLYETDTGKYFETNFTAICGFNEDDKYYCPKFLGESDFADNSKSYREMWKNTFNCHIESNKVNCKDVKEQGYRTTMAEFRRDEMQTLTPESYPRVANNAECTRDIINVEYWNVAKASGYYHTGMVAMMTTILALFALW